MSVQARRAVLAMPEYHPPLAGRDALRLDFNENTFSPSPRVLARIAQITAEGLTKYPERAPVEAMVATRLGLTSDQVLLTNGVDEAIHLVAVAFLEADDEALVWVPSFFMYDVSIALMSPGGLRKVQSDESMAFPLHRFLAGITPKTKLIIVASPNNPTGATISRDDLLTIAKAAPDAVVMVDEAYYHFHGDSVLTDIDEYPNLLVTRTFSKAYGLANLRVGLIAANPELIGYLKKVSSPYNVNGVALACLPDAMDDVDYTKWYVEQISVGRKRMEAGLQALGVAYFPSEANFILMRIGARHGALVTAARERGVLLRDRSADPGCDGYVRITIGIEEQVSQGLQVLGESLKAIGWEPGEAAHDGPLEREYE